MTHEQEQQLKELLLLQKKEEKAERDKQRNALNKACKERFGFTLTEISVRLELAEKYAEILSVYSCYSDQEVERLHKHLTSTKQVSYYENIRNNQAKEGFYD